jgi:hypothetical protein
MNISTRLVFLLIVCLFPCALPARRAAAAPQPLTVTESMNELRIKSAHYEFVFNLEQGVWDVQWPDGRPFLRKAFATWRVTPQGATDAVSVPSAGGARPRKQEVFSFLDPWGRGRALNIGIWDAALNARFEYRFRFYDDLPYFTVQCAVENRGAKSLRVADMEPLRAEAQRGGGMFLGADPARARILENGHKLYMDFWVRLVSGAEPVNSNWNAAFHDPDSGRSAVLGFVTMESAFLQVRASYQENDSVAADSWRGFSTLRTVSSYQPEKPVAAGKSWQSEVLFVMPDMKSPFRALEAFGEAAGARNPSGFETKPIPTGWNAWATSLHHGLTHRNMIANAKSATVSLRDFGMRTFQIDDGWMIAHGDWEADPARFPRGMDGVASEIRGLGYTPGIWIQPFCVSVDSALAREHPDWFAPKSKQGQELSPKDWLLLDPTHPEAAQWLRDLFRRISHDWGYKVIKIDFIYYLLLAERYHDPDATAVEAFRRGLRIIREAAGDDAFIILVAVPTYTGAGIADGMRLGLDITPDWGDDEGYLAQGVKPMLRNLARRYYLNHRLWISHPDMFYLGSPEEPARWEGKQATLAQARMYGTAVALSGAITKIGDQFLNLNPEQIDLLRRFLPVYSKAGARPVDLFEMQYPQVWDLSVDAGGEQWHAVGVFNWGRNRNPEGLVEATDTVVVVSGEDLELDPGAQYIAWGFWSDRFYGQFPGSGQIQARLAPVETDVIAIHRLKPRPQFLSTNRHVTQGGTDIESISWDPLSLTLEIRQKCDSIFPYALTVHVPDGFKLEKATAGGATVQAEQRGRILRVRRQSLFSNTIVWTLEFSHP